MEAQLAEMSDDRLWRVRVPGTIVGVGMSEQEAREWVERLEANRPDDAAGHAVMEQYDEPTTCPACGAEVDTDGRAA